MASNMDVFATILDHAGIAPNDTALPSRSLMPIISGSDLRDWGADVVFSEQEETRVIRTPKWAFFKRFEGAPRKFEDELFDVENDPGETQNLAADPAFADIVSALGEQLATFFEAYANAQADLWNGGQPIQHSERIKYWRDTWGEDWQPVYSYDQS